MTQTTLREYLRTTEDAISSGRIDEAMANCQNILTYFPEALEAQRLLGEVYLAQGQLEEAQQTFEWILTNDPENVIVYCDRALISERNSDVDTALDCYQQAYELSRGNANIRQEFNQLSSRAGQQEFMFSRAGLARLYMRGDLLTQAIQEWDAVLALNPDRLDARLGLMETYWHEGTYEKAEQVATLLLEEVPTCLKALLFQAHIASISNIPRARDLLVRAQALDPELTMALELFADLVASQPGDPFLELIRKEPILLENGRPVADHATSASTQRPQSPTLSGPMENTFGNWEMPAWEQPTQAQALLGQPMPQTPSGASWQNGSGEHTAYNQPQPEASAAPWLAQLEQQSPASQGQPSWYQESMLEPAQEEESASRPAWLGSLTNDAQPATPASSFGTPSGPQPAVRPTPTPAPAPEIAAPQPADDEAMPFFFPTEDENEGDTSWPEWLKSLGAEALDPEQQVPSSPLPEFSPARQAPAASQPEFSPAPRQPSAEIPAWTPPAPPAPAPTADPWAALPSLSANNETWESSNSQPDWMRSVSPVELPDEPGATPDWMQQFSAASQPQQNATPDWMQQLAMPESQQSYQEPALPASASVKEQEQRYLASLADLEKDLQAQGFVPMEPGSLASLAQTQQQPPAPFSPLPPQQNAQSSLSSALAQLGNLNQPPAGQYPPEPWWGNQNSEPSGANIPHTPNETLNPFAALGARNDNEVTASFAALPATPPPTTAPELTPAYRSDVLLDSDLETTMKRPAITLQPLKAGEPPSERPNGRGRNERRPAEIVDESSLSNQERLLRGYQYQLSGAYDESMQEYRLVIRNAPELLEDVISNLRALLKINPRFSLGYRVLGDAYMRKGEYLQAMESYNKALTMAKKAKN